MTSNIRPRIRSRLCKQRPAGVRPRLVEEGALGTVLHQQQLEQSGVAFEKRRFARSQIQVPHADESVVEPEGTHAREVLAEPGAPRP